VTGGAFLVLVVCALAAYRSARLVTTDTLFEGWRESFERWAYEDVAPVAGGGRRYRLVNPPARGGARTIAVLTLARGKLADLLGCPLCIGVWLSAGAVVGAWALGMIAGGRYFALWIPAAAGLQCLMSQVDIGLMKE
jgi:hypothetical protein